MPKVIKSHTYQLTSMKSMTTYLTVGKEIVTVIFTGGFVVPYKYNGTYTTNDPDVIKAIEASPNYNSVYVKIAPSADQTEEEEIEEVKPIPTSKLESVPRIASGQKARAYILARFDDVNNSHLRTNEDITRIATEKGIRFPDWII